MQPVALERIPKLVGLTVRDDAASRVQEHRSEVVEHPVDDQRMRLAQVLEGARNYDVMPDGRRFIMVRRDAGDVPQRFYVVSNWFQELDARASGAR